MEKKKREFDFTEFVLCTIVIIGLIGFFALIIDSAASVVRNDHMCYELGCTETISGKARYCKIHQIRNDAKQRANQDAAKKKTTGSNTSTPSSRTTVNSNYKRTTTTMPDCDDYESYDDFLDDWDGNMPDGSDASDYWDDW